MKTLNSKAIIINSIPEIYMNSELTIPFDGTLLQRDTEIELSEIDEKNNSIKVVLPDSTLAYIKGEENLHVIQPSWTTKETEVYNVPDESVLQSNILKKGEEFEILNAVEETNNKWLRIRMSGGQIYYMKGNVNVITEESLADSIGELIGQGTNKETIVNKFVKKGIPEDKILNVYSEIIRLTAEWENSPKRRKELADRYSRKIFYGILWAVGGTIATIVSMDAASDGGTYFIFWGAIIFGIFDVISGISGYFKYSS